MKISLPPEALAADAVRRAAMTPQQRKVAQILQRCAGVAPEYDDFDPAPLYLIQAVALINNAYLRDKLLGHL